MSINSEEQIFRYDGTSIKTTVVNGERFFLAKDVWKIIGSKWDGDKTTNKIPESQKHFVDANCYISKVGLFNVVLDNHEKPKAKSFWNWLSLDGLFSVDETSKDGVRHE